MAGCDRSVASADLPLRRPGTVPAGRGQAGLALPEDVLEDLEDHSYDPFDQRHISVDDDACNDRWQLWQLGVEVRRQIPLFKLGGNVP